MPTVRFGERFSMSLFDIVVGHGMINRRIDRPMTEIVDGREQCVQPQCEHVRLLVD
jgi:hypothetical protein